MSSKEKLLMLAKTKQYIELKKIISEEYKLDIYMILVSSLVDDIIKIKTTNMILYDERYKYRLLNLENAILSHDYVTALKLHNLDDIMSVLLVELLKMTIDLRLNELSKLIMKPDDIDRICESCNLTKEQMTIIKGLFICNYYINGNYEFGNEILNNMKEISL